MQTAVNPDTRERALKRLRIDTFDVLILGGGINGAGTARDLALRARVGNAPLNIALVEQNHFSSGTSGKNSHLIHGGLRYLKQFDFRLVREALRERAVLLKIAPHLVDPQPFLLPLAGVAQSVYYNMGLTLYDLFDGTGVVPKHRHVSLKEVQELEPGLKAPGMTGAAQFYDCQVRSARMVLENIFEAVANGAVCANYVRAEAHVRESKSLWRVTLRDAISGVTFETRARALVDSTGPWAHDPAPRLVRGSHIIMPRINKSGNAIAYFEDSGRIIFVIPWGERGDRTLIGTTDVDHEGSPDDVHISEEETAYLCKIAARLFPESAAMEPVASFSSLRPLLVSHGSATNATREHHIYCDAEDVVRITGGKFTTYRVMAEEAVDLITGKIAPMLQHVHPTGETALNSNTLEAIEKLIAEAPALAENYDLPQSEILMLIHQYGLLMPAVLEYVSGNGSTPDGSAGSRVDAARFAFARDHEMAIQDRDFREISTSLAHEGRSGVPIASI